MSQINVIKNISTIHADTRLTPEHQAHIVARGISLPWAIASCQSCDIDAATVALGLDRRSQSAGILLTSDLYGQLQFRPDEPWPSRDGKIPKYRTPQGEYDVFLAKHPENETYWSDLDALKSQCLTISGKPYLLITEGGFKAIIGCQFGLPTVALVGVTMGLTPKAQGDRDLVPGLKRLAKAGFGFIIAFDSDKKPDTIKNVRVAEKALTKFLELYGCSVLSVTGRWEPGESGETKGMDDFIQNKSVDEFRAILMKARGSNGELHGAGDRRGKQSQPPSQSIVAYELAETYRERLAWQSEYQQWLSYEGKLSGVWNVETEETIKGLISAHLQVQNLGGFTAGYVSGIATLLKSALEAKDWNEQKGLIPMQDGVLNLCTKRLLPHKPGYRFTWALPYSWSSRSIGCQPIQEFLVKITGGSKAVAEVLRAYLNACITGRSDLQRYLELIGGGGTGKSTFMTLAGALVGTENTVSSQLRLLENNQFETAKFYRKRLVCFPDSERWQGGVSVLKQMTGQDLLRYERKGVQQCRDYRYDGMVILTANEAPESIDKTSGQERRKLTIVLDTKVAEYANRDLIKEFEPYLPGLLEWVLEMSPDEVTRLVKHTDREVPALARIKWEQLTHTNPIAAWVDEKLVIDPEVKLYIGLGDIEEAGRWGYANFCKTQIENGHKNSIPMKRFSSNLRDLLKNQMKVAISEGRDRNGSYIGGIGLRCQLDPAGERYPCPVTKKPFCDGFVTVGDGSVMVETLTDVGFDGYVGFSENLENKTNNQFDNAKNQDEKTSEILSNESCGGDEEKKPSNPSNPTSVSIPAVTNPSQTHHNPAVISSEPIGLLIEIVRTAQTWAEVKLAWNSDEDLKRQIKGQLSDTELKRIGKLYKQAQSDASESESSTAAE